MRGLNFINCVIYLYLLFLFFCNRLLADNRVGKVVSQCCEIQGKSSNDQMKIDQETLMRAAPPEWACWKTGIELSSFGVKLLRVSQLASNEPFYGGKSKKSFFSSSKLFSLLQRVRGQIIFYRLIKNQSPVL